MEYHVTVEAGRSNGKEFYIGQVGQVTSSEMDESTRVLLHEIAKRRSSISMNSQIQ